MQRQAATRRLHGDGWGVRRQNPPDIIAHTQHTAGDATSPSQAETAEVGAGGDAQHFIACWQGVALTAATELSTSQTFVIELCTLLGVPTPLPNDALDYVFERPITFAHGDGSLCSGRIDCRS